MRELDEILQSTIERMRAVSDCDAVVGRAVRAEDGTVLIPVIKVSYGFVAGGGEYGLGDKAQKREGYPCAVASGGGITVTPIGFLVCGKEKKFLSVTPSEKGEKWKELLKTALKAVKKHEEDE